MRTLTRILISLVSVICVAQKATFFGSNTNVFVPIALISHANGAASGVTVTTGNMNCTGANALVAAVTYNDTGSPTITVSDSSSNVWHSITVQLYDSSVGAIQLWYSYGAAVSSVQTVTVADSVGLLGVAAGCFSNVKGTSANDQSNGATNANSSTTTIQPGSITPTQANELVVTVLGDTDSTATTPSGYTIVDGVVFNGTTNFGTHLAYQVQTTATATNPTWTISSAFNAASILSLFHN